LSKRSHRKSRQQRRTAPRRKAWLWLAIAGVGALVVAVLVVLQPWSGSKPQATPEVAGAPRLSVDQLIVDEGYVKYSVPIRTTFRLSNVGDQPLKILSQPQVVLVEGC
jgi:hypothetical protein